MINSIYNRFTKRKIPREKPVSTKNLIILPYYPKISHLIYKILKEYDFEITFKPVNKLNFSNLKDPINPFSEWGIYKIPCECGLSYIGQTKRTLKVRLAEHERCVRNGEIQRSAIAKHSWSNSHHFNFSSSTIIQKCSSILDLNFWEAFHILTNKNNLVNDEFSTPVFPEVWLQFI